MRASMQVRRVKCLAGLGVERGSVAEETEVAGEEAKEEAYWALEVRMWSWMGVEEDIVGAVWGRDSLELNWCLKRESRRRARIALGEVFR